MTNDIHLSRTTTVVRNEQLMSADVGQEVVMLHMERDCYYDADAIGAAIWRHLDRPRAIGELVDWLLSRYDVDRDTCERDVVAFLTEALAEDVICVVPQGGATFRE